MTNSELKQKIANAGNPDWFLNIQESFNFGYVNFNQSLKGVSAIYEFVIKQINGWQELSSKIPPEFKNSTNYFDEIKREIIQFVNSHTDKNPSNLPNYWQRVKNAINNTNQKPLPYNIPETEFLINVRNDFPNYFKGAYAFLIRATSYNSGNQDELSGAILAYEFKLKDHTEILQRRNNEKSSISRLRNEFQNYLSESESQLIDHLKNANDKYDEYATKIDTLTNEKDQTFTDWFENTKNEKWQKWYEPSVKKIKELEDTYREKLKLAEPAEYWKERAKKLRRQGWISLAIIIFLVAISCLSLAEILWKTPEQIYTSWFNDDKSAAIRWSIVYVTLISFIAFCIRAVTKTMFSSFHLARDSEERYTLTYFYLSLLKDSNVDDNDRQLIMQSLFSRAETGLLKDDSSPAMPNDTISRIITK